MEISKYTIIGTAGHIDHGKSALVKALTGTDPDRLSEEQERGMTIDLGFAFLNDYVALIDVPGHERFIKNMAAGVSTIDMVILVIAADDGVMPQTREHLDILQILQVVHGMVVITKADLVDNEWLEIVQDDITTLVQDTFLKDAPILTCSSVTGEGIDDLRKLLLEKAVQLPPRKNHGVFWMPVDRSFSIKGFGTVVTGSVLSGSANNGDTFEILPGQREVKVRGIQTHGKQTARVGIGERAAINLAGISKTEINRGDILAVPGYIAPSNIFDAKLQVLKNADYTIKNRARVRIHLGTRELIGRVRILDRDQIAPGETGYVQLQLESNTAAMRRDPFVVRHYSPLRTIGGGIVLDTNPKPHKRFYGPVLKKLQVLEKEDPRETILTLLTANPDDSMSFSDLEKQTGLNSELQNLLQEMQQNNQIINTGSEKKPAYLHILVYQQHVNKITDILDQFHQAEPLRAGMNKAELKKKMQLSPALFEFIIKKLVAEGLLTINSNLVKLCSHKIKLSPEDEKTANKMIKIFEDAKFSPPDAKDIAGQINKSPAETETLLHALVSLDKLVRIEEGMFFTVPVFNSAKQSIIDELKDNGEITVSRYRDILQCSRKYAMALLMYFDNSGLTVRMDDVRVLN